MRDPFTPKKKLPHWLRALEIDSAIDTFFFELGQSSGMAWERTILFFRRFHATGWKRPVFELLSESVTLGCAGLIVMLALAIPAFDAVKRDWRAQSDYSVTMLDRYGNEIGKRGVLQEVQFSLDQLPDHLVQAVLATEDRRFFEHFGIDVIGTLRALVENARAGGVVQGGSSITQQLAKNVFLSNERTLDRKIKEAFLALWLEANLTKREILKLYLDRAYMGGGAFGVGAASEFYFGKPVTDLRLEESAMLAGLFKAPTRYAPHINLPAARGRANEVLTNMVQAGFMTEGQVISARRHPATPVSREATPSPDYFLDWVFEEVKRLAPSGQRNLIVRTTIDMRLQRAAELAVESSLRESGDAYGVKQAALVSMDLSGAVRAMVGGRDYGASTFNRATNAQRQPGSSFKPYTYAAALEHGYTPDSVILDAPVSIGNWSPQNYSRRYRGRITMMQGLTHSINTIPVRLSIAFGRQPIAEMAERLGVQTPIRVTRSLPLGTSEVTVLDQATGYAAFASGGFRARPHGVARILTPDGEVIYDFNRANGPPKRVLSEEVARDMVKMMHNVAEHGTGRRALIPGVSVAGKTGTTQAYRDAWFVGYTGDFSTAVWLGNDNYKSTNRLTGGTLPAMTWQKYMRVAEANIEHRPLPGIPLPPPAEDEVPVAEGLPAGGELLGSGRLAPPTEDILDRLEERAKTAEAAAPALKREASAAAPGGTATR
ncbi:transglycosylase domain-containing protein [Afifella marina]|uniref:Penicillin-binding protein 1A n=1 Tax=Afifella marina DSM 2698 TaxID=1120955 RepID=A0A1G5MFU4_AFIMA|nr:PBP1A family penicillin-binding protein [Afifella marina]MBK1625189.1 penicillin-binding protein [Afifella marina DSM 2698]MBK1628906.1 penicillin-binding protein [Afifella marina]MBK5918285.1 penicillin-binding protein [Afifella marina]RAI22805.1 penicillin-binding protein [Afifella marina DSM 2698]SCZ24023.1 penicillin-binding protein 1A [Afifella marina DSM 2698]